MKKLLIAILALLSLIASQGAGSSAETSEIEPNELWTYDEITARSLLQAVRYNSALEVYLNDYERYGCHNADQCGLLVASNKDFVQVSHGYMPLVLSFSMWFPQRSVFLSDRLYRSVSEDMLTTYPVGEAEPFFSEYSEEQRYKLTILMQTYRMYADYIYNYYVYYRYSELTGEPSVDFENVFLNMDEQWGVTIDPRLESTVRIHYKFTGRLELEFYYDEVLIESFTRPNYELTRGIRGECEGDIVLPAAGRTQPQ